MSSASGLLAAGRFQTGRVTGGLKDNMSNSKKLDRIAFRAQIAQDIIGLVRGNEDATKEEIDAALYVVSDYLADIGRMAEKPWDRLLSE